MNFRLIFIRNFFIYLFIGLSFIFPRVSPIAFSIAFFLTLFTGEFKGSFVSIFKNRYFILFCLFFIIHAVSIGYSSNKTSAWSGFELKSSFLIFPLFFPVILNNGKIKTRRLLEFSYLSAIISFIVCLGRASYLFVKDPQLYHFFSSDFSFIVHPSYLAVMLNILLMVVIYRLVKSDMASKKIWIVISILTLYIVLAASKIGLVLLFLNVIMGIVMFAIKRNKVKISILFFTLVMVGTILTIMYVPVINSKYHDAIKETFQKDYSIPTDDLHSTAQRIVSWKATYQLINENIWKGVGMGDLKDELTKKHHENGFIVMEEKHLDSHQQFMQTWATVGVLGFAMLICLFLFIFYDAIKQKSYILFMFGLTFFLFGLTESMFETQAGVLGFLTFFYLLSNKNIVRLLKFSI